MTTTLVFTGSSGPGIATAAAALALRAADAGRRTLLLGLGDAAGLGALLGAAPGLSRRLQKLKPEAVATLTGARFQSVRADTPLWEGISRLNETGESVPVLDADGMLQGVISEQSLFEALEKIS
jgi:CBS-domain-containing membrane protein